MLCVWLGFNCFNTEARRGGGLGGGFRSSLIYLPIIGFKIMAKSKVVKALFLGKFTILLTVSAMSSYVV